MFYWSVLGYYIPGAFIEGVSQISRNQSGLLNWHIYQFSKPDWFLETREAPGMYIHAHVHTLTCPHTKIHYHIYVIKCYGTYYISVKRSMRQLLKCGYYVTQSSRMIYRRNYTYYLYMYLTLILFCSFNVSGANRNID